MERLQAAMLDEDDDPAADVKEEKALINFTQSAFGASKSHKKSESDSKKKAAWSKGSSNDYSSYGPPPSDAGRPLNDIGRNGMRPKCFIDGSDRRLIRDHLNCKKNNKVNCAQDFMGQVASSSDDDEAFEDGNKNESSSSYVNLASTPSSCINLASSALRSKSDMRSMMGDSEALCATRPTKFKGILADLGAQESAGGMKQYLEHLKHVKAPPAPTKPSGVAWAFGESTSSALFMAPIRLPIDDDGNFHELNCLIVDVDMPILFGDVEMEKHDIDPLASERALASKRGWRIPMSWRSRHFWIDIDEGDALFAQDEAHEMLFTKTDLLGLRKKSGHALAQKLRNLLKRANEDVNNADLDLLKDVGKECFECQKFAKSPLRWVCSAPEDIQFSHELVMRIMRIDNKPILQIACAGARFTVAAFLTDNPAEAVWPTLLRIWLKPRVGAPHILKVDQGSEFVNDLFHRSCQSLGIFLMEAPIESPSSMGLGERFYDPLRRIFLKLRHDHSLLSKEAPLQDSHFSINCAMEPEGHAPILLAHGMLPRLPIECKDAASPSQAERMKALATARSEMEVIVAKLRLKTANNHNAPASLLDQDASPGMLALALRKSLQAWEGPFELLKAEGKTAHIEDQHGLEKKLSVANVKPLRISDVEDDQPDTEEGRGEANKVNIARVFSPREISQQLLEDFQDAINEEMSGLLKQEAFVEMPPNQVTKKRNALRSRFALAIKNLCAMKEKLKARLVALGRLGTMKGFIVNDSPALMRHTMRLVLALAGIFDLQLCSRDVKQAYLQSDAPFMRGACLKPPKGYSKLSPDALLKPKKPLCGVIEAGS
eukprot:Plantae.Rhodophyta-Hildenbrandia_rubra.ctg2135.p1 GENE.Plantae.Rhodophyta-Hildenbrandia_rubra.ctg2135~~Plantae.Rhodophyta-Hildenbrandia_rubra.ctg2135.p1  ORF type:complete len:830 (-),score=119.74 Plantae.Rhodophyta-Hildenbrandia_rubra.ctg2135:46-2535(-)